MAQHSSVRDTHLAGAGGESLAVLTGTTVGSGALAAAVLATWDVVLCAAGASGTAAVVCAAGLRDTTTPGAVSPLCGWRDSCDRGRVVAKLRGTVTPGCCSVNMCRGTPPGVSVYIGGAKSAPVSSHSSTVKGVPPPTSGSNNRELFPPGAALYRCVNPLLAVFACPWT